MASNMLRNDNDGELKKSIVRLARWKAVAIFNLICTILLAAFMIGMLHRLRSGTLDVLRLHRLAVIDDGGKERIVITAPLKERPIVGGREGTRRVGVSAAIQFKEADGTERGGIALAEDGSFMFGIDDEQGRERAHLYYIPKRGSGVYLQSPKTQTVSLLDPPLDEGDASLTVISNAGVTMQEWPPKK